jgi:hypothetical protein
MGGETGQLVFDSELLFLDDGDFDFVGLGAVCFFFEGVFEFVMLQFQGFDLLIKTHGLTLRIKAPYQWQNDKPTSSKKPGPRDGPMHKAMTSHFPE